MTATPIQRYWFDGTDYVALGRASLPGPPPPPPPSGNPRDDLVPGTYIPGWTVLPGYPDGTVGLADPGANFTVLDGDVNGIININSVPGGVISDTIFKGKIVSTVPFKATNSILANREPGQVNTEGTGNGGCVQNFGSNPPFLEFEDCLLDPQWWFDQGLSALKGSPLQVGVHGGNMHLNRVEIINIQDGFECVGPTLLSAHNASSLLFENGWVHKAAYFKPWPAGVPLSPASGDTHSDGIQFNTHPNVEVRYSMIGGVYDGVGYAANPAYNSGDDCHNSAIIMAQEGSANANQAVFNVDVHHCWLMGGAATVNLFYKNGNTGGTWNYRFNKIARRGSTQPAGNGFGIYASTQMTCPFLSIGGVGYNTNVVWDPLTGSIDGTGVPTPIVRY